METTTDPVAIDRVREHSAASVNTKIDRETAARIETYEAMGPVERGRRLAELDREWDIDRTLMLAFSVLGGLTFTLGVTRPRRLKAWNGWLSLFGTQLGFLGFHAVVGWCPPMVVFRRLGIRSKQEIERERRAIQAIDNDAGSVLAATTRHHG